MMITSIDLVILKETLIKVREQGFAVDDEEMEIGIKAVAAPIFPGRENNDSDQYAVTNKSNTR